MYNDFFVFNPIQIATEIRCQEKSKGGLSYEVILGQPVTIPPLKTNKNLSAAKKVSAAEIERKLCEAEKRRLVRIHLSFIQMKFTNFHFMHENELLWFFCLSLI